MTTMNYPDPNIAAALAAHYGSVARSAQPSRLGLSRRELERYSLARAILASSRGRLAAEAGFEREVSLAEAKARGIAEPLGASSFYVPDEVLVGKRHVSSQQYDGELVGTDVALRGIVGETLRSMSVVGRLGVRVEENMTGNLTIPVVTVPPTATWLSEERVSQITETQPTFTSRPATPKTVAALTKLSHQLLKAAPDLAERLALRELQSAIAEAVDAGVLDGSGHSGEMQGIVNGSLVGSVVGDVARHGEVSRVPGRRARLECARDAPGVRLRHHADRREADGRPADVLRREHDVVVGAVGRRHGVRRTRDRDEFGTGEHDRRRRLVAGDHLHLAGPAARGGPVHRFRHRRREPARDVECRLRDAAAGRVQRRVQRVLMSTKVVVRRALWHDGISYPAGSVIALDDEADAIALLESGRCELHDPRDAAKLKVFALGELRRVMQRVGGPAGAPPPGPWQPWH